MSNPIQNFFKANITQDWSIGTGNFYVSVKPSTSVGRLVVSPSSDTLREIIEYTSTGTDGNGDYIVVSVRGVGGTTEQTHTVGEKVRMNITAEDWEDMRDDIDSIVAAGAVNGSETERGIFQKATDAEVIAGSNTGSTGALLVATPSQIKLGTPAPVVRTYSLTSSANLGTPTSRFDITNTSGTTFRYTWDGTGTDPVINTTTFPTGAYVWMRVGNFNLANQGQFAITSSGTNYFEITNAAGVAENDKSTGATGDIFMVHKGVTSIWTKPVGLKYVEVEVQGGGGGAYGWDTDASYAAMGGAGGGGYAKKNILAASLGATETVTVGIGGLCGKNAATPVTGFNGLSSSFGTHCYGNGGALGPGTTLGGIGGTATGGDININGKMGGLAISQTSSPRTLKSGGGGDSHLGFGGQSIGPSANGNDGQLYGGGASGICDDSNVLSVGGAGIVIVKEFY